MVRDLALYLVCYCIALLYVSVSVDKWCLLFFLASSLSALVFAVWRHYVSRWQTCCQGYGGCSRCFQNMAVCSFLLATTGKTSEISLTQTLTSSKPFRNMNPKACTPQPHCEVRTGWEVFTGEQPSFAVDNNSIKLRYDQPHKGTLRLSFHFNSIFCVFVLYFFESF